MTHAWPQRIMLPVRLWPLRDAEALGGEWVGLPLAGRHPGSQSLATLPAQGARGGFPSPGGECSLMIDEVPCLEPWSARASESEAKGGETLGHLRHA